MNIASIEPPKHGIPAIVQIPLANRLTIYDSPLLSRAPFTAATVVVTTLVGLGCAIRVHNAFESIGKSSLVSSGLIQMCQNLAREAPLVF